MEIDLGSSTNLYWDFGILIFINFLRNMIANHIYMIHGSGMEIKYNSEIYNAM